jgi:hypothetical protein
MMLNNVLLFCGASFLYGVVLVCYLLVLSPLARFPGSKLAAVTLWYEFYYEVIKRGQFTFKVREWHEKYGKFFPC